MTSYALRAAEAARRARRSPKGGGIYRPCSAAFADCTAAVGDGTPCSVALVLWTIAGAVSAGCSVGVGALAADALVDGVGAQAIAGACGLSRRWCSGRSRGPRVRAALSAVVLWTIAGALARARAALRRSRCARRPARLPCGRAPLCARTTVGKSSAQPQSSTARCGSSWKRSPTSATRGRSRRRR